MNEELKRVFLEQLKGNKDTPKEKVIEIAEDLGIEFKAREAKIKIIDKIVDADGFEKLFDELETYGYIAIWEVADFYSFNTEKIEQLTKIGVIKEEPLKREYYSRSSKSYYKANTYPVTVLEYSKEELDAAYKNAFGQEGFKIRLETSTEDEVEMLVEELKKIFILEKRPAIYEKRNEGYNSYLTIKIPNGSKEEHNRMLAEIEKSKQEVKYWEKYYKKQADEFKENLLKKLNIFGIKNISELEVALFELKAFKNETQK